MYQILTVKNFLETTQIEWSLGIMLRICRYHGSGGAVTVATA